jgi:hypothetical protein
VAALTFGHVQQRDGRWCIIDLVGKRGRVRTVPMPTCAKVAMDGWTSATVVSSGSVFRPVNRAARSPKYLRKDVPCGGRRTAADSIAACARIFQTTERYLGTK